MSRIIDLEACQAACRYYAKLLMVDTPKGEAMLDHQAQLIDARYAVSLHLTDFTVKEIQEAFEEARLLRRQELAAQKDSQPPE